MNKKLHDKKNAEQNNRNSLKEQEIIKCSLRKKGEHAYKIGNIQKAAKYYYDAEDFDKAAGLFEWAEQYDKAAYCYFKNREYIAAADNYLKASKEKKAAEMFELGREFKKAADLYLKIKKYRKAGDLYERVGENLKTGESFILAKKNEEALLNLEKVKETAPDFSKALLKITEILLQRGKPDLVIEKMEQYLENRLVVASNVKMFYILGEAYKNIEDFINAHDIFMKIFEFDSSYPEIRHRLEKIQNLKDNMLKMRNIERYENLEIVGRGAMGIVYKAEDLELERTVAIKILNKEAITDDSDIERFFSEAKKIAKLKHPNIVTVYDVGYLHDDCFISMEFIEGINLSALIKENHPIPIKEILIIAKKLFTALVHSHRMGIIHRDVKPQNIMITYENEVKVVDFGIAVLRQDLITGDGGLILGSPYYMSPEQIESRTINHQTDIYSAGVTLFHLICGRVPYNGSILEIFDKHLNAPFPLIKKYREDIPEELIRIIKKCTIKNIEERFQDAKTVLNEIENVKGTNGQSIIENTTKLAILDEGEKKESLEKNRILRQIGNNCHDNNTRYIQGSSKTEKAQKK